MRSNSSRFLGIALALIFVIVCSARISAQTAGANVARITQAVNESDRVTLKGNTHPLASAKYDQGAAPDTLPMERMLMVLKRSPDQELALKTLMEGQQSKTSANFHQWLTPDEFGQQFGVSDSDIQTVTAWLQAHGFQVNRVAAGKMLIEFSGTAGQVHEAFQTQIHKYVVKGEAHWANSSDPSIPSALAPVITGVNTLHNFGKKAMVQKRGVISRSTATGAITPLDSTGCPSLVSIVTASSSSSGCNGVTPADLGAIYKIPSTIQGVAPGTGQTIAVVGDSDICTGTPLPSACTTDDVKNYRTIFGLPTGGATNTPQIILDGPDPGFNTDELEGDLDVQYSGAIAPNAQILFVIAEDTETAQGIDLAAERIVDYNLAPVMNESFGECEPALGTAGNAFYSNLWEQAAAQGITVVISAGDGGSAACDQFAFVAQNGLAVNGIASTLFNVAVGGTDFDSQAAGYPGNFWNTTTGANGLSARGYIPETTWNDSCAQSANGQTTGCVGFTLSSTSNLVQVAGGGGGQSNCALQDEFGDCEAGYIKPSWQMGSSVPNDMLRDVPDVSLFASDGPLSNAFFIICEADLGATCATSGGTSNFFGVGGTSGAAPTFAGIMTLVNQNMLALGHSGRQGNPNFVLYPMSAGQNEGACNSSLGPASTCIFNDVVKGNNSEPCLADTFNCSNTTLNSPAIGVLETVNSSGNPTGVLGFVTGTGFDLATGLGSLNVTNLVSGWPTAVGAFTGTSTTLALTPLSSCAGAPVGITNCISITHGGTVNIGVTVTGGPNIVGDVTLVGTCQTATPNCFLGGSNTAGVVRFDPGTGNVDFGTLTNGTVSGSTNELIGGTYNVTAHYAGDGVHGASDSLVPYQVKVSPEGSRTQVSFNGDLTGTASAAYGTFIDIRTDIFGASSGFETATGQVTLSDTFPGFTPVVLNLNSEGHVELQTPSFSFPGNNPQINTIPALGTGVHSFTATYAGDASYAGSVSVAAPFTVTKAPTVTEITTAPTTVPANTNFTLVAFVDTESGGNSPTGIVTFFAGGVSIGTAPVIATLDAGGFSAGQATLTTAKISATAAITAQYGGDTNYTASAISSPAVTVTATTGPTFTLTPATSPVSIVAGNSGTSVITVAPANTFTGTVALTCSVSPVATSTPTCSFSANSVILGAAQNSTLMIATTATTSAGSYTVLVTGTSGSTVSTTQVLVNVVVPGITVTPSPTSFSVVAGNSGTSTIAVAPTNGFAGTVALTCTITPVNSVNPTCSFTPPSISLGIGGTSTLTVATTATTTLGVYTVTVKGTSGSVIVTAPVTVTVTTPGSFTLAPSASSFTASAPGQSASVTINATGTGGFTATIAVSASVSSSISQTFPPVCTAIPTSIVLSAGSTTGSSTVTCTTTAAGALFKPTTRLDGPRWLVPAGEAAATLVFTMFLLWIPALRKRRGLIFAGLALFVGGVVCSGCGGAGGGSTPPPVVGTQTGSYTVTVTAAGGGQTQTTTSTFVLQ